MSIGRARAALGWMRKRDAQGQRAAGSISAAWREQVSYLPTQDLVAVTHNHQRPTFELLLVDAKEHFQTRAQAPVDVLYPIGTVLLRQKSTLLGHEITPHDQLGSI